MKSFAIVAFSILLLTGCSTMESAAKGTFSIAWDAAEAVVAAKLPMLEGKVMEYARAEADKVVDKACEYAALKAVESADKAIDYGINKYKIDLSQMETYTDLMKKIAEENERRKATGEDPISTYGTAILLALLTVIQTGKTGLQILDRKKANAQPPSKTKP